jgi:hypothetical protein
MWIRIQDFKKNFLNDFELIVLRTSKPICMELRGKTPFYKLDLEFNFAHLELQFTYP